MAAIFRERTFLGKRLTCPMCRDSAFFTDADIQAVDGKVMCSNHAAWVEMVDLAELLEIWGHTTEIHPDDFEEW